MGRVDLLQMRVWIRKFMIISFRTCYRSVCNHPFIVGVVLFAILLNRSSPFLFSLLLSSLPVLVCTAVLLGILLSFGKPNVPEIEKEDRTRTHVAASLKTRASKDATGVVERDERCAVERLTVKRRDILQKAVADLSSAGKKISLVDRDHSSWCNSPLIDGKSREIQCETPKIDQVNGKFDNLELEENKNMFEVGMGDKGLEGDDEDVEIQYLRVQEVGAENLEEHNRSFKLRELLDDVSAEQLVSSLGSSKHEEDLDDASSDSGSESESDSETDSDEAQSSSPDASMADILPMLDELHPLLDSEGPQPAQDEFDGASEQSHKNEDGSDELEEDTENLEEEEDGDDDNDDEEETQIGDKSDVIKSAITWTADDQKNLMDLGTSELERNQQLEKLLARRKARKIMTMMNEKNLIDLESTDLPFPVAPISTGKRNPFDLPYDSYDDTVIPGSAPSILLPRRNPFDIPYVPDEEKPDLTEGGFQQELIPAHQKDMAFRRHESFSVGHSHLGFPRQDRSDVKFRSYFLPGRLAPEGTTYSSFQRLPRDGDSKLSPLPEAESLGSPVIPEDKKIIEHTLAQETEMASDHVAHGSQSSEDTDSVSVDIEVENRDEDLNEPKRELEVLENHSEAESISEKGLLTMRSRLSKTEDLSTNVSLNDHEVCIKTEAVEVDEESSSRSSSLEESEEIIDVKQTEGLAAPTPESGVPFKYDISLQPSLRGSNFKLTVGSIDGIDIRDPVYDSSPPADSRNVYSRSSSSISSDLHVEVSEMGSPLASLKTVLSSPENESVVHGDVVDMDALGSGEVLAESVVVNDVNDLSPSSDISVVEKDMVYIGKTVEDKGEDQISLSSVVGENSVEYTIEKGGFTAPRDKFMFSERSTVSASEEPHPSLAVEHQYTVAHPNLSSQGTNTIGRPSMYTSGVHQSEQSDIHPLSYVAKTRVSMSQDWGENLVSTSSNNQGMLSEEKPVLGKQLPGIEKSIVEPPFDNHEGHLVLKLPQVGDDHVAKEENDTKDTDEENLLETRTIGDFSVKRRESNGVEIEELLNAVPESLSKLQDLDIGGVEDNYNNVNETTAVIPLENTIASEAEDGDKSEGASELPASVASSAECVDSPLEFVHEVTTSVALEPTHEEIVSEDSEVELANSPRAKQNTRMSVIKTHMVRDIDLATKETGVKPAETILEKSEVKLADSLRATQNTGLPVIKTCMVENVDLDVKEIEVKPAETILEKSEVEFADSPRATQTAGLPVINTRSVDDIDMTTKETEVNPAETILEKSEVELADSPGATQKTGLLVIKTHMVEDIELAAKETVVKPVETVLEKSEVELADSPRATQNTRLLVIKTHMGEDIDLAAKETEAKPLETILLADSPRATQNAVLPVIETHMVEDIDLAAKQTEVKPAETNPEVRASDVANQISITREINLGLPVLEAVPHEDTESASKKITEDELVKPAAGSLHEHSEHGSPHKTSPLGESILELPVVGTASIKDIDSPFEQFNESLDAESSVIISSDDRMGLDEIKDPVEMHSELRVSEAKDA